MVPPPFLKAPEQSGAFAFHEKGLMIVTFRHIWDGESQTWVVYRVGKDRHAHLGSEKGCLKLISLIKQGKLPRSQDFRDCCERLLSAEEYEHLGKSKGRYYNYQRRRRR